MKESIPAFEKAILLLDRVAARNILKAIMDSQVAWSDTEELLTTTLERIGQQWEEGSVALAQVYMCGRICEELVAEIVVNECASVNRRQPKIAIAILEDYHFLGMRMVSSTLQLAGYELIDYGHQDVDSLVARATDDAIEILLISTLMLSSALKVATVKKRLDSAVKVIVGGAPFRLDEELWKEVGADGMGKNASDAVVLVASIIGGGK